MFSIAMIASSTSRPIAIDRPPSVIVSICSPKAAITRIPVTRESGIAKAEMNVVRTLPRKRARMTMTRIAPSRSASATLPIATSMKSAWRKFSLSSTTPRGSTGCRRASVSSMARVRSSVFAPGCFCTDRMTAGRLR